MGCEGGKIGCEGESEGGRELLMSVSQSDHLL